MTKLLASSIRPGGGAAVDPERLLHRSRPAGDPGRSTNPCAFAVPRPRLLSVSATSFAVDSAWLITKQIQRFVHY